MCPSAGSLDAIQTWLKCCCGAFKTTQPVPKKISTADKIIHVYCNLNLHLASVYEYVKQVPQLCLNVQKKKNKKEKTLMEADKVNSTHR